MFTDPTTLFALALCIGILGLLVLILPLFIVFWSQMEPQLVGMMGQALRQAHADQHLGGYGPRACGGLTADAQRHGHVGVSVFLCVRRFAELIS